MSENKDPWVGGQRRDIANFDAIKDRQYAWRSIDHGIPRQIAIKQSLTQMAWTEADNDVSRVP
ncbi:hypothetical protein [Allorhodopirellula heiligendammensis]|uniref:hypothetical protein n=1 Tax=Allorhodopirellula heiligendammensis TaxID=2714739 RepID=UPI0011B81190|nr:hypothetical protein [Allorhodopirellula heiligendammensis]